MNRGKEICKVLKDVRRRIAEENDIAMDIPECTFKGECRGTCPRCEAELRYLDSQLRDRRRSGRAVKIAGIAAGALALLSPLMLSATPAPSPDSEWKYEITTKGDSVSVSGTVVSKLNDKGKVEIDPLHGIFVKNMRTGVEIMTNENGEFELEAARGDILRFRGLGFKTLRKAVTSLDRTTFELRKDNILLGESFAVGKKPSLVSAGVVLLPDSVVLSVVDSDGKHVKFEDDFYYVDLLHTNSRGKILKDENGDQLEDILEFDVDGEGNVFVNYDEILDHLKPQAGKYPESVVLKLHADIYKDGLEVEVPIPERVVKRYIKGNVLRP